MITEEVKEQRRQARLLVDVTTITVVSSASNWRKDPNDETTARLKTAVDSYNDAVDRLRSTT